MRTEDLPLLTHPHVCEVAALRGLTHNGRTLQRRGFVDGRVQSPFYLLVRVCDVEGAGTLELDLYDEAGKRLRHSLFPFGKPDRYYSHVIVYEHYSGIPPGTIRLAVFVNGRLRDERPLQVFPPDAAGPRG